VNSRRDSGPTELFVLLLSLVALVVVLAVAMITAGSDGAEPIPLPTAPTTTILEAP
jgi:hypothetical protein